MKYVLCAALALTVLSNYVCAEEMENAFKRTVSVSGTVERSVPADQIVWTVWLTDEAAALGDARERNDAKVERVLGLRKQLGIAAEDIATTQLTVTRRTDKNETFRDFRVRRSVTIRQHDLERFGEYLDALFFTGDIEVSYQFVSSRFHEIRKATRLEALEEAKAKATAMAKAMDAALGPVLTIREGSGALGYNSWDGAISNFASIDPGVSETSADMASDRFAPSPITVKVSVQATFALK